MTKPAVLAATYSDLKLIKTRQCVQIVFEVPLANFDAAYEVLGGFPDPARERWFGIAALDLTREGSPQLNTAKAGAASRNWKDLSPQQQAGMRCAEPAFAMFLKETRQDDWHESNWDAAECVRLICCVESRADLETNQKARVIWKQLDDAYQAWKILERIA